MSTSRSSGHTPASYNQGSLRRNSAGIGSKNQAVGIRPPALESDWSNTGKDEANLKFFTWSADNLPRRTKRDTAHDIACESWHLGIEQDTSTEAVQMVLYDASGILTTRVPGERMSSTNMTIMCSSGSAGPTMTRNVYDETDLVYGWIPSTAHYGQPLPRFDFERIFEEEEGCY